MLAGAGLLSRVRLNSAHGIPLSAYDDASAFKAYCLDIGLLRRLARLNASAFATTPNLFAEFKGAFAENYVLRALEPQLDSELRYWTNDKPKHEVDFIAQINNDISPIEVKSGQNVKAASLRYYAKKHESTPIRVRLSLQNLAVNEGVLNIPLYLAHRAVPLIEMAMS